MYHVTTTKVNEDYYTNNDGGDSGGNEVGSGDDDGGMSKVDEIEQTVTLDILDHIENELLEVSVVECL